MNRSLPQINYPYALRLANTHEYPYLPGVQLLRLNPRAGWICEYHATEIMSLLQSGNTVLGVPGNHSKPSTLNSH